VTLRFDHTPLDGVFLVHQHAHQDERGAFKRFYGETDFAAAGIAFRPTQASSSYNPRRLTLRGMHWQKEPFAEAKLVRVTRGRAFDVAIDLRPGSATQGRWFGYELSAEDGAGLYIPRGLAHGFLTLFPDTEVSYLLEGTYEPPAATGFRYDDPAFAIEWPAAPLVVSDRDLGWSRWAP
jgi:dTDP-4-dehydrorhamnose 3,5-epimerase